MQLVSGTGESTALDEFVALFGGLFPRPEAGVRIAATICSGSSPSCPARTPSAWPRCCPRSPWTHSSSS